MNLKSLRTLFAACLIAMTGHTWAAADLPKHENATWQDIASILWSTDGGNTWSEDSNFIVGQTVQLQVAMHKTNIGNHFADFVKVWIDWNGMSGFTADEVMLADYRVANATERTANLQERLDGKTYKFESSFLVTNAMIGTRDLLARVTCSESLLGNWDAQWDWAYTKDDAAWYKNAFLPTGFLYQGELHTGKITVTGNSVPEPGTLALLAAAMLGMGLRRKSANSSV